MFSNLVRLLGLWSRIACLLQRFPPSLLDRFFLLLHWLLGRWPTRVCSDINHWLFVLTVRIIRWKHVFVLALTIRVWRKFKLSLLSESLILFWWLLRQSTSRHVLLSFQVADDLVQISENIIRLLLLLLSWLGLLSRLADRAVLIVLILLDCLVLAGNL